MITSYYEGKTRLYQFNAAYPLLSELEQLLKKAYTLLPAHEKKDYYVITRSSGQESNLQVLLKFWEKLAEVQQLAFNAKTKSKETGGWNGKGQGEVVVAKENHVMVFKEKGSWRGVSGEEVSFSNVFRWTLDKAAGVISLEHLRRGENQPVFLFHLVPAGAHSLRSVDSHLCGGDAYFGQIHLEMHGLRLNWRAIGPKKNEEMDYYYS